METFKSVTCFIVLYHWFGVNNWHQVSEISEISILDFLISNDSDPVLTGTGAVADNVLIRFNDKW